MSLKTFWRPQFLKSIEWINSLYSKQGHDRKNYKETYGNANGKKADGHHQRHEKEKDINEKQQKKETKKAKDTSATSSTTSSIPTINGDEQNKIYKKIFAKYNLRGKKNEM